MSGICGLACFDGASIDGARLERMTSWLTRCGPDGRATWNGGDAGFGHALLDTTGDASRDRQPCTLDGARWIVADARIDSRSELVTSLAAGGRRIEAGASDAELLLHAWREWGERLPERLLGDFAFALWDAERRTLFCARDHLGVKPFFYAPSRSGISFASSPACLHREAGVADAVDELAIADFLLFERSQDPGATVFAAIRRLPPAHCLALSPAGLRVWRYWQLPPARLPRARRDAEILEEFDELLDRAVADRIRSPRVAMLMSGGLDSPALASIARRQGANVKAFCTVYDRILPDEERHYSSLAARFMGIPIQHLAADDYGLFERYRELSFHFTEPLNAPFAAADLDFYAEASLHSRVALTGWDGDALLSESPRPYFRGLAEHGRWLQLAHALMRFAAGNPASAMRSLWLRARGRARVPSPPAYFPPWLDEHFARRLRLRERWEDDRATTADPLRPRAHLRLDYLARLATFFEPLAADRTGTILELRHPFFDLRVVTFCLSIPPVPWCIRKEVLRRWLRGRVPEAVRLRPKAPLPGYPHLTAPARPDSVTRSAFTPCAEAAAFVDRGKMASIAGETDPAISWADLRPRALDLWFRQRAA